MLLFWLACNGRASDGPNKDDVIGETANPDDTAIVVDDTGEIPDGDWSLSLQAPSTARLTDGSAAVDATCVALDGGMPTAAATTISGDGFADGVLTFDEAGTVELTCTGVGLSITTSVSAFNTTIEAGWIEAGEAYEESLAIIAILGSGGEPTEAELDTLREHAELFARMPGWKDPSVPMVPGGYPTQEEIEAAGYAPNPDDEAISAALDEIDTALDAYTAAVAEYDFTVGDTSGIEIALDQVELAAANAQPLAPSVGGALAQRDRLTAHLNEHLLPAMAAGPNKVIEGIDAPPFFTSLVDLSAVMGIRGTLIDAMYGPALDWIAVAVDTLATVKLLDAVWAPDANGPDIWSVNYGGYVIFEGNELTICGNGFSEEPELNQIIFVHGGLVSQALGLYSDCKDAVDATNPDNADFFDMYDKMDKCVDGVVDALNQEPVTSTGTGPMTDGQDLGGVFGDYIFSIGVPPVTYAGPWVDLTAMIPVNLSNGLRGDSHNVLLYPPQ